MGKIYNTAKKIVAGAVAVGVLGWLGSGFRHVAKDEAIIARQVLQTKNGLIGPTNDPYKRTGIRKENGGWTYIQPIGLGVVEEYIKIDEPQKAEAKFAYFTKDWLTGKESDQGKVRAFKINLELKVENIEKYAQLDPQVYNNDMQLNPTGKKIERGAEYLAEILEAEFKGTAPTQQNPLGTGLASQLGLLDMQVRTRFDMISYTLLGKENLAPEEKIKFYKQCLEEKPWLKINAAMVQQYLQQGQQLAAAAQQEQQLPPEYMLPLMVYQAFLYDQQEAEIMRGKEQMDKYKQTIDKLPEIQKKAAMLYLQQQETTINEQLKQLESYKNMQLMPFFKTTLQQTPELVDEEVINYALEKNVNMDLSKIDLNDQKQVRQFVQGLVGPIMEKKVTGTFFKDFVKGLHEKPYEDYFGIKLDATIEVVDDDLFTSGGTVNTEYMNVYQNLEEMLKAENPEQKTK